MKVIDADSNTKEVIVTDIFKEGEKQHNLQEFKKLLDGSPSGKEFGIFCAYLKKHGMGVYVGPLDQMDKIWPLIQLARKVKVIDI